MGNTQSRTEPENEYCFQPKPREMSISDRINEFIAFLAENKKGYFLLFLTPLEALKCYWVGKEDPPWYLGSYIKSEIEWSNGQSELYSRSSVVKPKKKNLETLKK